MEHRRGLRHRWAGRGGGLALGAFGLDSLIEVFASVVVLWQLRASGDTRTSRAMALVALAFLALAALREAVDGWRDTAIRHACLDHSLSHDLHQVMTIRRGPSPLSPVTPIASG